MTNRKTRRQIYSKTSVQREPEKNNIILQNHKKNKNQTNHIL